MMYNCSNDPMQIWSHKQPDNCTFELCHKGRNFFSDAGGYACTSDGTNSARKWYQSLAVVSNGQAEIMATKNQGYNNLKYRQYVFFVNKTIFVLVDEGIGSASGTVNLNCNL
jgi:heparan-sulfate lyase